MRAGHLRAKSRHQETTDREENTMFQLNDPTFQLDLHRQRAAELRRDAAAHHLAHEASAGRPHRRGWWRSRTVRDPA
jgi:hypothetical protein